MRIFIEPTEPLLFRTGRPFTAGENTFAESIFPPTPETLQGALRAAVAVHWGQKQIPPISGAGNLFQHPALIELIGKRTDKGDTYGRFRITGATLGRRNPATRKIERLFPAPAHVIQATLKDETGRKFQQPILLQPEEQTPGTTDITSDYALLFPGLQGHKTAGKAEPLTGWLTSRGLMTVLQGNLPRESSEHLLKTDQIYVCEPRLGIGMQDEKKTTKEGYLYLVQMIRMQPGCGFVVDIAWGEERYGDAEMPPPDEQQTDSTPDLAFIRTGWLTLGGEQRAAHFTVLEPQESAEEDGISRVGSGNLLYFATPAYFKQGWLPEDVALFPSHPLTAAINRYVPIGGWYLNLHNAGGGSKMMRRCVPAGSVYFFNEKITVNRPLTEYGWQIGYGITYTGEWKQ